MFEEDGRRDWFSPKALLGGLVLIGLFVAMLFYLQRGAHMALSGSILNVRTLSLEENASILFADFRFTNPADYPFVVDQVTVLIEDAQGKVHEGRTVPETDAKRLFEYYPSVGQKFNESLYSRSRIPPKETADRMIASRFDLPESELQNRKSLTIRVEEVDGTVSELASKGK